MVMMAREAIVVTRFFRDGLPRVLCDIEYLIFLIDRPCCAALRSYACTSLCGIFSLLRIHSQHHVLNHLLSPFGY